MRLFPILDRLLHCRLCWRVTLAVFVAIFVVEAVILVPSFRNYERDLLARLEEVGRSTVTAAFVAGGHESDRDLLTAARLLPARTRLKGGRIWRADGRPVGSFGEALALAPERLGAAAGGGIYRDRGRRYEVIWSPAALGLPLIVAGRLDSSDIAGKLVAFLWRIAGLVLLISVFVCGVAMLLLGRTVLAPLLRIRGNLAKAVDDPADAASYALRDGRRDELGEVSRALDRLLYRVSKTHREDLAAMVAMVEGTGEGILALDGDGRVAFANRACLALCGADGRDALAAGRLPRFCREGGEAALTLERLTAAGPFSGEVLLVVGTRPPLPCFVNAARILDGDGRVLRHYASISDISELRAARARLERQNLELNLANQAKNAFLANMSHELRTPLNAIIGFSEFMQNESLGPLGAERYRDYVGDIKTSGQRLLGVINDILDLSKIEAEGLDLHEEVFDPATVIAAGMNAVRERASAHRIAVIAELPERLPALRADPVKVRRILVNLLSNAVKFTPEGGTVSVSARAGRDGCLKIAVDDTGIGIAEENLARVFDPFAQADSGLARKYEGAGLGLALARALAELHDGALSLKSRPGRGTTATVRFPPERVVA